MCWQRQLSQCFRHCGRNCPATLGAVVLFTQNEFLLCYVCGGSFTSNTCQCRGRKRVSGACCLRCGMQHSSKPYLISHLSQSSAPDLDDDCVCPAGLFDQTGSFWWRLSCLRAASGCLFLLKDVRPKQCRLLVAANGGHVSCEQCGIVQRGDNESCRTKIWCLLCRSDELHRSDDPSTICLSHVVDEVPA